MNSLQRVSIAVWTAMGLALFTSGCDRQDAQVYTLAKEGSPSRETPATNGGMALPEGHPDISGAAPKPSFAWTVPEGWTEAPPGEMRVASFRINADGKEAEVSVIPLPGMAGSDAANVNRWRSQLGLQPEAEEAALKSASEVEAWGKPAALYDISGTNPSGEGPGRILAVIQRREETAWFFKMTGDEALVAQQKPAFLEFLKSFHLSYDHRVGALPPSHPPLSPHGGPQVGSREAAPKWQAPGDWKELPAGQFLVGKFAIGADGDPQAMVNISRSQGDGGGLEANVNRWRGQLGQQAWTPADLSGQVKEISIAGSKASFVEMRGADASGRPAGLVAVVVQHRNEAWFYKLMGDVKLVDAQKQPFLDFVKGVTY